MPRAQPMSNLLFNLLRPPSVAESGFSCCLIAVHSRSNKCAQAAGGLAWLRLRPWLRRALLHLSRADLNGNRRRPKLQLQAQQWALSRQCAGAQPHSASTTCRSTFQYLMCASGRMVAANVRHRNETDLYNWSAGMPCMYVLIPHMRLARVNTTSNDQTACC